MVREIILMGDSVLRTRADDFDGVDDDVRALIDDMFETMYAADGVGLAGPQIGLSRRIIVVDPHEPDVEPFALINARVVETGKETDRAEEGCLSIPGIKDIVERPSTCIVEGLDREGEPVRIEAGGFLARVLQHEVDHLDGILFLDRLTPLKRRMALRKWQKTQG